MIFLDQVMMELQQQPQDPASVFGMSDVLEAQLRSNRTQTTQSDSPDD